MQRRHRRPACSSLLIGLSLIVCGWFAFTNYQLNILIQEEQENSFQTYEELIRINKQIAQFHGKAQELDNEYETTYPKIEHLLRTQKEAHISTSQKLKDAENKLQEEKTTKEELKKTLNGALDILNAEHKEQVVYVGQRFRNNSIIDLSVIVAFDWDSLNTKTRSLSLLYVMDYFNKISKKNDLIIEMVFVHPAQSTIDSEFILSNNMVSEFKSVKSKSLEALLNEGSRGAKGKYLLFIPVLASPSGILDIELFVDIPKMLSNFEQIPSVGIVGGITIDSGDGTLLDAGIDFAYGNQDAVTPFARYIGAGLHYPKVLNNPPCVSKAGMMIEAELFNSIGGFSGIYTKDRVSTLGQLMEDSDLCLRVLSKSRKINVEHKIKTRQLSSAQFQSTELVQMFNLTWASIVRELIEAKKELTDFKLVWDLYCGCTGVNVEAINYLVAMESKLDVGAVAGSGCWCGGFPTYVQESLLRISSRTIGPKVNVWVTHKPPDKYPIFPYKGNVVVEERPSRIIGRSMSETDTIKSDWVQKSERVDEIWVPTEFHRQVFSGSGINASKLTVIEESLDTSLYDPEHIIPFPLSPMYENTFKFLSVFKWEARKGWDVLLQGYFEEFGGSDNVVLVLQTYLYGERNPRDRKKVEEKIKTFAATLNLTKALPPVLVLTDELPEIKMPQLYKACDAFVLPTRGEGWGLPVMEAMAMGLPSIVTNWSGPTEFTTKDTAYLLPYDTLETVPKNFEGGSGNEKWAKPSLAKFKEMMRTIYSNPTEAKKVGKRAREHIVKLYDRDIIGDKMVSRLKEIQNSNKSK